MAVVWGELVLPSWELERLSDFPLLTLKLPSFTHPVRQVEMM